MSSQEYTPEQLSAWWDAYYRQQEELQYSQAIAHPQPTYTQYQYTEPMHNINNLTTTNTYISRPEEYMQQQSVYSQSAYEATKDTANNNKKNNNKQYNKKQDGDQTPGGKEASGVKKLLRVAGGEVWEDKQLAGWDPNDFRIFVGDLGGECDDEKLAAAFAIYPSFQRATVIRDKRTGKSKGYGFVSYKNPNDFAKALRELNGKYIANRPIKLRKSSWKSRNIEAKDLKKKVRSGEVLLFPR